MPLAWLFDIDGTLLTTDGASDARANHPMRMNADQ
jgi:hypothetical protein